MKCNQMIYNFITNRDMSIMTRFFMQIKAPEYFLLYLVYLSYEYCEVTVDRIESNTIITFPKYIFIYISCSFHRINFPH